MDGIKFLETVSGSVYDVCNEFYLRYLKNEKDSEKAFDLFKHLISKDILTDRSYQLEKSAAANDSFAAFEKNSERVNQAVNNLIEKGVTEEEFYRQLWNSVYDNILFDSDEDKISILLCLVSNPKIPYYRLDTTIKTISEEEFEEIINHHFGEVQKVEFIMNMNYDVKTDTASQLLALLDTIEDQNVRSVVLASALGVLYDRIAMLMDMIRSMNDEDEDEDDPEDE